MEHVRRYKEDLFFLKDYCSVIENVSIRLLNRDGNLKTTVSVDRVVLRAVVVPNTHVGTGNKINFFNIVTDDSACKTSDRLLILARY
jgi:hypothetical protein